jgi:SAM-dependent methyltransferase
MARVGLYDYQQPWIDLLGEALEALGPVVRGVVGDVGCGNGRYVDALRRSSARVIGIDLSRGMLADVPTPRSGLVVADAQTLPLASASLDAVLMMHMLYHVPDPEKAVAEAARVLQRGGRVLVSTNSPRHLVEMNELWLPLLHRAGIGGPLEDVGLVNPRLTVGAAAQLLRAQFREVVERYLTSAIVVTDSAPVVRHAASTTGAHATGVLREALLQEFAETIDSRIQRDGAFRITTEVVLLAGRNG